MDRHSLKVNVALFHLTGFTDAQAGRIDQRKEDAVLLPFWGANQAFDFLAAKHCGQ